MEERKSSFYLESYFKTFNDDDLYQEFLYILSALAVLEIDSGECCLP